MTTEIQNILVNISDEAGIQRKVQPVGISHAEDCFIYKRMGFDCLVRYYDDSNVEIDRLIAPYRLTLYVDNTTLVNPDGTYADENAVIGENGVVGEFDWLITIFQVGGLNFETFFPFVINRADNLERFNRL